SKPANASPRSLAGDLIIGAVKRSGYNENHLKGVLDELRIWNKARTNVEITAALFTPLSGSEAGLAAYYPFNEGTGQVAGDLSPFHNHGRLGTTTAGDDADPRWVVSDRPTSFISSLDDGILGKTAAATEVLLPQVFRLLQNYPNPFNAGTTIAYDIPADSKEEIVTLTIYDIKGQMIRVIQGSAEPGSHQLQWDGMAESGQAVSSGVYVYRLDAGSFSDVMRMVMIK
ncbi:MAG: T9SS C-terminal target domain-containing protein, partial [Calditrichaeota bacterium]